MATSIIEEATNKAFDENTVSNNINSISQLTSPNKLGPESGEAYTDYNDVDDYNGYSRIDSSMPSAVFKISCSVAYVSSTSPNVISNIATWNKKVTVTISSISMRDTVTMSSIFSYWYFR